MKQYVNGSSFPIFYIKDDNNNVIETIELPLCNADGLIERFETMFIEHELQNYSTVKKFLGHHIYFNLSYSEFHNLDTTLKIGKLMNYILENYRLVIQPRADIPSRSFSCIYSGNRFELGLLKGGIRAGGNRGINLEFRTKNIQSQIQFVNPNDICIPIEDMIIL